MAELPPGVTVLRRTGDVAEGTVPKEGQVVEGIELPEGVRQIDTGASPADITTKFVGGVGLGKGGPESHAMVSALFNRKPDESYWEKFQKDTGEFKKSADKYAERHPGIATTVEGVGAAAPMVAAGMTGPGAAMLGMTGGLARQAGLSALTSGALSAAHAYMNDQDPRAAAISGAALGAAIPGVSKIAGAGGGRVWESAANYISRLTGRAPTAGASALLDNIDPLALKIGSKMMQRGKRSEAQIEDRARTLGDKGMLFEQDANTMGTAEGVSAMPGYGQTHMETKLTERAKQLPTDIEAALDQGLGPRMNMAERTRQIEGERANEASPLYKDFHATPVHPTDELKNLYPLLERQGIFAEAKKIADLDRKPFDMNFFTGGNQKNWPTTASWDYAKRAIDVKIGNSFDAQGKPTVYTGLYTRLKNDLIDAIDRHPDPNVAGVWQKARKAWADPSEVLSAQKMGLQWKNIDPDELPYVLRAYSQNAEARAAFNEGVRKDLANTLDETIRFNPIQGGSMRGRVSALNELMSPANQQRLNTIMDPAAAENLITTAQRHDVFANSMNNVLHNSHTAKRLAAMEDLKPDPEGTLISRVQHLYSPHVTPFRYMIPRSIIKGAEEREATKFEHARDVLSPLLTKQGSEGAEFAKALLNYKPPNDLAAPLVAFYTNALLHGAIPKAYGGPAKALETLESKR